MKNKTTKVLLSEAHHIDKNGINKYDVKVTDTDEITALLQQAETNRRLAAIYQSKKNDILTKVHQMRKELALINLKKQIKEE